MEEDLTQLKEYLNQNEASISSFGYYMNNLIKAIDDNNVDQIVHYIEMLRGVYHLLEGNNINIKNLIQHQNPAFQFLGGDKWPY